MDRSRPLRLGASLDGASDAEAARALTNRKVLFHVEGVDQNTFDTLELAANQALRMGLRVGLSLPAAMPAEVGRSVAKLARAITGNHRQLLRADAAAPGYDCTLAIGTTVRRAPGWITVTSDGWVARSGSWIDGEGLLPRGREANPIGADLAASIGMARVFRYLFGRVLGPAFEWSAHSLSGGTPGSLPRGPEIARSIPDLDALLVGCGSVMQGWANTIRRLPISGHARAIDPQLVADENLGTYVRAFRTDVGLEKVNVMTQILGPKIRVEPDRDYAELFSRRLEGGIALPPVVVAGLDEVNPRHLVQRWWPRTLIDMATEGFATQVIVKEHGDNATCLLDAHPAKDQENGALQQAAKHAGLVPMPAEDLLEGLTERDVELAPEALTTSMAVARAAGMRRCSWISSRDFASGDESDFSGAAPFVASLAGTIAAGRTLALLAADPTATSVRVQTSFASERMVILESHASANCECQTRGDVPSAATSMLRRR